LSNQCETTGDLKTSGDYQVMRKIFISHESVAKREAVKLKELLSQTALSNSQEAEFFLTSDWYSLESGAPWFSPLVEQLREADGVITIITRSETFHNLWISFEIGVAYGSKKFPKIFVFGGVPWNDIPHPIGGLQLTDTGDTNRWIGDLRNLLEVEDISKELETEFAILFRQK